MAGQEQERIQALQKEVQALGRELYRRCMASHGGGAQVVGVGRFGMLSASGYDRSRRYVVDLLGNGIEGPGFEYVQPEGYEGLSVPDEYCCMITLHIMTDPVLASDGLWYEASALQTWYKEGGHRVGMYKQPLDQFCVRISEVQDLIDRWVKELGDTGPQKVGGRSLQGAEKKSWRVKQPWAGFLPFDYLEGEVHLLRRLFQSFLYEAFSTEEELVYLLNEFVHHELITYPEGYAKVLLEARDQALGNRDYHDLQLWSVNKFQELEQGHGPWSQYPVDRKECIAVMWNLLRSHTLLMHTLSREQTSRTDVEIAKRPRERVVDFSQVLKLREMQPSAMLVKEMVYVGADPSLPWDFGTKTGTSNVLFTLQRQVASLKACLTSVITALQECKERLKDTLEGIRRSKAEEIATRILHEAWFLLDGADFDRPLAPLRAPLAYEAPEHVLEMWPQYPADRYRYMKTLFLVESLGELALACVDKAGIVGLGKIQPFSRSTNFVVWELRALRMANVDTDPLSALDCGQVPDGDPYEWEPWEALAPNTTKGAAASRVPMGQL